MHPVHHVSVIVSDYAKALAFYEPVLATLGFTILMKTTKAETNGTYEGAAFGRGKTPDFWIGTRVGVRCVGDSMHIGFGAGTRAEVDAFYKAALAAGAKDNGAPGLRGPEVYSAFVFDLDGTNIEATCQP